MSSGIFDLEEVVEKWAYDAYMKTKSGKTLQLGDLFLDINWSKVTIIPEKPTFEACGQKQPSSHVIFKSVFRNDSGAEQSHSLKTERETTATCTSTLTKGYSKGINVGLTLAAPGDVAKASVGFEKGFSIENTKQTSDEKTLTWSAEGSLSVKPNSSLTAVMEVKEIQCSFNFHTKVDISGKLSVSIYDRKDNSKFLMSVMGSIDQVLLGNENIKKINQAKAGSVTIPVNGKCDFKYGIEQKISCTAC